MHICTYEFLWNVSLSLMDKKIIMNTTEIDRTHHRLFIIHNKIQRTRFIISFADIILFGSTSCVNKLVNIFLVQNRHCTSVSKPNF